MVGGGAAKQRKCPSCGAGVEDMKPILVACPLLAPLRERFPDLFFTPSVSFFMQQQPALVGCRHVHPPTDAAAGAIFPSFSAADSHASRSSFPLHAAYSLVGAQPAWPGS